MIQKNVLEAPVTRHHQIQMHSTSLKRLCSYFNFCCLLTWFCKWLLIHPLAYSWNDDLCLFLEPHPLDGLSQDLNTNLPVLFDLVLKTQHQSFAKFLLVKNLQNLIVLLVGNCLLKFIQGLSSNVSISITEHIKMTIVPLLKLLVSF